MWRAFCQVDQRHRWSDCETDFGAGTEPSRNTWGGDGVGGCMTPAKLEEVEARAVDSPSPWARNHITQYLASGGARVDHPAADRLILLYTTGRRSGAIRRLPVVFFPGGDDMLIVASKAGASKHPEWYLNLVADPHVWVRFRYDFFPAVASTLDAEERAVEWPKIIERSPAFADYQAKAGRVIPVIRLRRS